MSGGLAQHVAAEVTVFDQALLMHCEAVPSAAIRTSLVVALELAILASCPTPVRATVFRIADELVGNAVEHGFYNRQRGRIEVRLERLGSSLMIVRVFDDGWGINGSATDGNGFHLLRQMGELSIDAPTGQRGSRTGVSVSVPVSHIMSLDIPQRVDVFGERQ